MLHKRHNSVVPLFILLTLVGASQPAKAFMLAQANETPTTFTTPEQLPQDATVNIAASNSTNSINKSLKENFTARYPEAQINIATQASTDALKSLAAGEVDLVSIGRALTPAEKDQGFVAIPISREKIAIVVSQSNPFNGNLTIDQFAQIFRGEITDWSELGGPPGEIKLVDLPDSNDTRQAFPSYPVFQEGEFRSTSSAIKLEKDNTDAMIAELGENGVGYAVANDVMERDDVKVVTMHQTQPDDQRYPFSQPFNLVYKGTPTEATQAYLGFAATEGGEKLVANRVGSLGMAAATAIATGATQNTPGNQLANQGENNATSSTPSDASQETSNNNAVTDAEAKNKETVANADVDTDDSVNEGFADSGNPNSEFNDSGELNPEVRESGEINPDFDNQESGTLNPDLHDSGSINPEVGESGAIQSDLDNSGESVALGNIEAPELSTTDEAQVQDQGTASSNIAGDATATDTTEGTTATENGTTPETIAENATATDTTEEAIAQNNPTTANNIAGDTTATDTTEGTTATENGTTPETIAENATATDTSEGAIAQNNTATPETPEATTTEDNTTARSSRWWLWLIPLLGISLLGAMFAFGGKKKSDQEPAITNLPHQNNPNGGINTPGTSDGGDISAIGANVSGNVGNVAENTINNTSKLGGAAIATGGAAIAGGAAAAANLLGKKQQLENEPDIDLDLNLNETETANEIPVNPVSEFTNQETELQSGDQSTKLQTDDDAELSSQLMDNTVQGSTDLASGVVATEFTSTVEENSVLDREPETNAFELQSEQTTDLINQEADNLSDSVDKIDSENSLETNLGREFGGDFVLQEEAGETPSLEEPTIKTDIGDTTKEIANTVDDATEKLTTPELELPNVELTSDADTGIIDRVTESGGAAIAGGASALGGAAAAASGFLNREQPTNEAEFSVPETTIDTPELNSELNLDLSETAGNVVGEVNTPELELPNVELSNNAEFSVPEITIDTPEFDSELNLDLSEATGDVVGEVATPELELPNIDLTNDAEFSVPETTIDTPELNSGLNLDLSETTGDVVGEVATPELNLPNIDLTNDTDTGIIDRATQSGGTALAGGAAALGGAAAAASGFLNRDRPQGSSEANREQPIDAEFTEDLDLTLEPNSGEINLSLDEITLEESSTDTDLTFDQLNFDDNETSINASFDEVSIESADTNFLEDLELDTDINISDEQNITLDDLGFAEVESQSSSTSELLSNRQAEITNLADDQTNDMNNISEWLDSLDTSKQQDTDNIAEWLSSLDTEETTSNQTPNQEEESENLSLDYDFAAEADDISFKFLEDLLDRDSNSNSDS